MNNAFTRRRLLAAGSASLLAWPALLRGDAPASRPARKPGTRKDIPPRMSFIANDHLKLGIDLAIGGAITHLSPAGDGDKNLVNSWDLGRQIQMSYYAGPAPYTVAGHAGPPDGWKHIGWNPIQVGDDYGNPSRVVEQTNDGKSLYLKCIPMQWPLDDVPGECTFECWISLEGPAARVRCRINMARADTTQWPARTQEMPAVYTNAPWHRLFSYSGDKPFTDGELQQFQHDFVPQSPWANWQATENWAALVDEKDWGLGIWNPGCVTFSGGFAGKPGRGGPKDSPTGYIAPNRAEILDHNIVLDYTYAAVLGDLKAIRKWVYGQPNRLATTPNWTFEKDRGGWHYRNATDAGWPIRGELDIALAGNNPQIISPPTLWQAADGPKLVIEAAFDKSVTQAAIYWATAAEPGFSPKCVAITPIGGAGNMRPHELDLSRIESYRGLITQLRIDPKGKTVPEDRAKIKSIAMKK